MSKILSVEKVSKYFGSLRAVDDVSFAVEEKTVTILIGPNGSGKTTMLNVISGLYKPDSGKILYNDKEITGLEPFEVYRLGIARSFQVPNLFLKLTVLENVAVAKKNHIGEKLFFSPFRKKWIKDEEETVKEAFRILRLVGLENVWDKKATEISGGQMKLLEIGRALMSHAKLILLDEPISGVNPTLAHEIFEKLVMLKRDFGLTFLIVEHRLDIALSYVDTVIAMAYGKLLSQGEPEFVLADPKLIQAYLGG